MNANPYFFLVDVVGIIVDGLYKLKGKENEKGKEKRNDGNRNRKNFLK